MNPVEWLIYAATMRMLRTQGERWHCLTSLVLEAAVKVVDEGEFREEYRT